MAKRQITTTSGASPAGAYSQGIWAGDLVFVSGQGPLDPATGEIVGETIEEQTERTLENVKAILEAAGSSLDKVVDVTAFLIDMDRDFAGYNEVYREYFAPIGATRTTLAISALPTPIAVELKVIARA